MELEKPVNISRFELLMYAAQFIALLSTAIQFARISDAPNAWRALEVPGFFIGLAILVIWLAARRRQSWARWVLAALFVTDIPGPVLSLASLFVVDPLIALLSALQTALQILGFYFAFSGSAREWFRRPPATSLET